MSEIRKALDALCYTDKACRFPRAIGPMRNYAESQLPRKTAEAGFHYLLGRPLIQVEADALEVVAGILGKEIRWQHLDLLPTLEWEEGRHDLRA